MVANQENGFLVVMDMIPRFMAVVSIFVNSFGLYLILNVSPKSLRQYKYILLTMMFISFEFDIVASLFVGAVPLPGAIGVQMIGILAKLFNTKGNLICALAVYSIAIQAHSMMMGFMYREYTVTNTFETQREIYIRKAQIASSLIWFFICIPVNYLSLTPEKEARAYMEIIGEELYPNCAIYVVPPEKGALTNLLLLLCCILMFLALCSAYRAIKRINKALTSNRTHMSENSIKLHKMFLRSLIWQFSIPFLVLVCPCTLMLVVLYIMPYFQEDVSTTLQRDLTSIALTTPSFYSPCHVLSMIYFTAPYKKYCLERSPFHKNVEISRFQDVTVTRTRRTDSIAPSEI